MNSKAADFGIYVHIPFCITRCGYCDFNTYVCSELETKISRAKYVDILLSEIDLQKANIVAKFREISPLKSIYFGGGTPSLLSPEQIGALLQKIQQTFEFAPEMEITLEANPDTITAENLAEFQALGINRISLGMQSASESVLKTLSRLHRPENTKRAIEAAKNLGLNTSLDLIFGAPGESLAEWKDSLVSAIELGPNHISCYGLTLASGTPLANQILRGELAEQDEGVLAEKYLLAEELLGASRYRNYEISNWAKPGFESKHNSLYWKNGDWLGLGAGAHSHFENNDASGYTRFWNIQDPVIYADAVLNGEIPAEGSESLDYRANALENIMLSLRVHSGLKLEEYQQFLDLAKIRAFEQQKLLIENAGYLFLSLEGKLLADLITREIIL